jgi:hypothetical protein
MTWGGNFIRSRKNRPINRASAAAAKIAPNTASELAKRSAICPAASTTTSVQKP